MAKKNSAPSTTPRKRTTSKKKPNGQPTEEDIRVRAYHRYLERGADDGGDFNDWVEAEKDLKASRS